MRTITHHIIAIILLFFITGCSSDDDTVAPKIEQQEEQPEAPTQPQDEEVDGNESEETTPEISGSDLLFNGTAVLETNNMGMPHIFYHTDGTTAAVIDENLDGLLDQIVLTDFNGQTVIEMDSETGLPKRMYTAEDVLVLYEFKEGNTQLDMAVLSADNAAQYIRNIDVSMLSFTAKHRFSAKEGSCAGLDASLVTMANGVSWALGGWCKIKEDNNVIFQSLNLSAQECRDIYRTMFPCCQISVFNEAYCAQLGEQAKVLSEIATLTNCAEDGELSDCITSGISNIQNLVNNADALRLEIGEDIIIQTENILFDIIENNLGGNNDLVGLWKLEKQEELSEGLIDTTLVGSEYCDDPPNENSCYTIIEATLEFRLDGTFTSILTELDKQNGPNGPSTEIVEKEEGQWSFNEDNNELYLALVSYEYFENGAIVEQDTYVPAEIVFNESFTISDTELIIVFDAEDANADGIPEERYTEFYIRD